MKQRKERQYSLSRKEAFNRVPVKNEKVTESRGENGDLLLTFPITLRPWFAALTARFSSKSGNTFTKKIQLDTLGTQVWRLIDGKRTVRKIIREFGEAYQLHNREAEVSVTQFLRMLGKKGLIGIK